jgi:hypoxanthine phosphoribosyltransferase
MKVAEMPFWNTREIAGRIAEMGRRITDDYAGKKIMALGMLEGSFIFMADLVRHIRRPVSCSFMDISTSSRSSGITELSFTSRMFVEDQDVLLVEDVLDTGVTLAYVRQHLEARGTRSIRVAALLDKPACRRVDIQADYIGLQVPDQHFVGYGLDCGGAFRNLPYLTYITESAPPGLPLSPGREKSL